MMIIGCDFHTRHEQIAMMEEATGELDLPHTPPAEQAEPSPSRTRPVIT